MPNEQGEFTPEEIAEVVAKMKKMREAGPLPRAVFHVVTEWVTTPCDEVVPLRIIDGRVHVLLTKRKDDDPTWPSQEHSPGAAFRPGDTSHDEVFHRILRGELDVVVPKALIYVGQEVRNTKRGSEKNDIFWVELEGDVADGEWFPVDALPSTMIDHQIPMIVSAAREFAKHKGIAFEMDHPGAKIIKLIPGQPYQPAAE
jgi:hypothetical protein